MEKEEENLFSEEGSVSHLVMSDSVWPHEL